MALPIFQRTVTNSAGDIIVGAEISVFDESTGLVASIFSNRDGTTPLTNPFFTGSDGLAQFYAQQGEYRITASSAAGSVTWRYEPLIGTLDEGAAVLQAGIYAQNALASANAAAAAANYKGDWTASSDVKQGESYTYQGQVWIAKQDSLNVTPVEGAFWIEGFGDAVNVRYDNTASGLTATDVQGAIDEVEGRVDEVEGRVDTAEADILTNQAYVGGQVIATGSAVFSNTDNSITLTGVGVGVEIGDVITITGAPSNSKEFTIEEITSAGKIIVNKEHAGGTTTKSLVSETATVTVKLLCKWYLAPIGLGQGWVSVTASRIKSVDYVSIARNMQIAIAMNCANSFADIVVDSETVISALNNDASFRVDVPLQLIIPKGLVYRIQGTASIFSWSELR